MFLKGSDMNLFQENHPWRHLQTCTTRWHCDHYSPFLHLLVQVIALTLLFYTEQYTSMNCLYAFLDYNMLAHFVYGSLQEVVQQVTCFSQRARADHYWGVHRIQLILQGNTIRLFVHSYSLTSIITVIVCLNTLVSSICTIVAWQSDRLSLM